MDGWMGRARYSQVHLSTVSRLLCRIELARDDQSMNIQGVIDDEWPMQSPNFGCLYSQSPEASLLRISPRAGLLLWTTYSVVVCRRELFAANQLTHTSTLYAEAARPASWRRYARDSEHVLWPMMRNHDPHRLREDAECTHMVAFVH